jgi:hypothetical protein
MSESRAVELFPHYVRQYRHNNDTDGTGGFVIGYDKDIEEHATRIIHDVEKAAEVLNQCLANAAKTEDKLRARVAELKAILSGIVDDLETVGRVTNTVGWLREILRGKR